MLIPLTLPWHESRGRQVDVGRKRARRALGARTRAGRAGVGAASVGARGAGRGRAGPGSACAHGGHAGWVSWASLGFGEPGSVLTQFLTRF